jgi:hypothetical protein
MAELEPELMTGLKQALYQKDKGEVLRLLQLLASKGVKVTFKRNNQRVAARLAMTLPSSSEQFLNNPGMGTVVPRPSYYGSP